MTRRHLIAAMGAFPLAAATVPRPSPDFEIMLLNGRKVKLSQYKGKVLAFACVLTS
ncbi:MAG TPA: hypothetical protein VM120_08835 [Bryobacteraceae bacterium]|nr:hypothetical protein [Bryobacteraceae bacterium]